MTGAEWMGALACGLWRFGVDSTPRLSLPSLPQPKHVLLFASPAVAKVLLFPVGARRRPLHIMESGEEE